MEQEMKGDANAAVKVGVRTKPPAAPEQPRQQRAEGKLSQQVESKNREDIKKERGLKSAVFIFHLKTCPRPFFVQFFTKKTVITPAAFFSLFVLHIGTHILIYKNLCLSACQRNQINAFKQPHMSEQSNHTPLETHIYTHNLMLYEMSSFTHQ